MSVWLTSGMYHHTPNSNKSNQQLQAPVNAVFIDFHRQRQSELQTASFIAHGSVSHSARLLRSVQLAYIGISIQPRGSAVLVRQFLTTSLRFVGSHGFSSRLSIDDSVPAAHFYLSETTCQSQIAIPAPRHARIYCTFIQPECGAFFFGRAVIKLISRVDLSVPRKLLFNRAILRIDGGRSIAEYQCAISHKR